MKKIYIKPTVELINSTTRSWILWDGDSTYGGTASNPEGGQTGEANSKQHDFFEDDDYPQDVTSAKGFAGYSAWDDNL